MVVRACKDIFSPGEITLLDLIYVVLTFLYIFCHRRMSAYECVTDYMRHLLHVFDDRIMVQGIGVSVDW